MEKPKTKRQLKECKQQFYDRLIEDPKMNVFVERISKTSIDDPNFAAIWEEMHTYMDKEFQKQVGLIRKEAKNG